MKRKRIKIKLTIKPKPKDEHDGTDRALQRQLSTLGNVYDRQIASLSPKRRRRRAK